MFSFGNSKRLVNEDLKKFAKIAQVQEENLKKVNHELAILKKGGTAEAHFGILLDVCRKQKLKSRLLDFLEEQDILKLANTCKAARHVLLLGFRPIRLIFNKKNQEIENLKAAHEKAISRLAIIRPFQWFSQDWL